MLSALMRDRFGWQGKLKPAQSAAELVAIVARVWEGANLHYETGAALVVAKRAEGIPQGALHLARLVLHLEPKGNKALTTEHATQILKDFRFDDGFSDVDWLLLDWGVGAVTAHYGAHGVLPPTTVIASTGIPWSRGRRWSRRLQLGIRLV